ncbi:hypothetical protein YC2023_066409 [Brassica napus]
MSKAASSVEVIGEWLKHPHVVPATRRSVPSTVLAPDQPEIKKCKDRVPVQHEERQPDPAELMDLPSFFNMRFSEISGCVCV